MYFVFLMNIYTSATFYIRHLHNSLVIHVTSLISYLFYLFHLNSSLFVSLPLILCLCCCNMQMSPRGWIQSYVILSYLTFVVVLLSGLQGSCAATVVDPWLDPDDPWPWTWPWESLLWEMDNFFFRGRPFRLGAEGKETVTIRLSI